MTKIFKTVERLTRWFFGSPFQELPPEFGDPVPSDLRLFEAKAVAVLHQPRGRIRAHSSGRKTQTESVQVDEFQERETH